MTTMARQVAYINSALIKKNITDNVYLTMPIDFALGSGVAVVGVLETVINPITFPAGMVNMVTTEIPAHFKAVTNNEPDIAKRNSYLIGGFMGGAAVYNFYQNSINGDFVGAGESATSLAILAVGIYLDPLIASYSGKVKVIDADNIHLTTDPVEIVANKSPTKMPTYEVIDPNQVNFSQRTVSENVSQYTADMKAGNWDWEKSGPIRVMFDDGKLVTYDNRRLMAAQNAGVKDIPYELVNPNDIMPGSKKTWAEAFEKRFNDSRNVKAGGAVPRGGLKEQPQIAR
jgi:hypothetical protein